MFRAFPNYMNMILFPLPYYKIYQKVVYPYWMTIDFAGNLGMQETKMAQAKPKNVPAYFVSDKTFKTSL